jgi:hypothetical protein
MALNLEIGTFSIRKFIHYSENLLNLMNEKLMIKIKLIDLI